VDDAVGAYIGDLFAREDDLLLSLREDADRSGLPPIHVAAQTGRLLQILIAAVGARRILEIGTLGGYSAIWMGRALDDGRIVSLEIEPRHADFARRWIKRAGLDARVEVRVGRAVELLPALDGETFDLTFIDADKEPLPTYLDWALRLTRPGGIVVADNALWGGRVVDASVRDAGTLGVRELNRRLAADPRVVATVLPVGDGVAVGVVRARA
jgi:predicted O-methyltransferase YrrM